MDGRSTAVGKLLGSEHAMQCYGIIVDGGLGGMVQRHQVSMTEIQQLAFFSSFLWNRLEMQKRFSIENPRHGNALQLPCSAVHACHTLPTQLGGDGEVGDMAW